MKPTHKSDAVNSDIFNLFGVDRVDSIKSDKCVAAPIGCGQDAVEFSDALSKREYSISGLCQKCQNSIFGD